MYYDELTRKGGMGGMIFAAIGGAFALMITFTFIYIRGGAFGGYGEGFIDIFQILEMPAVGGDYIYLWSIPILGIMAIVMGAVGYALQKKAVAYAVPVFGIVIILVPLIFVFQFYNDFEPLFASILNVFYFTLSIDVWGAGTLNIMWIFIGAIISWISAGLILAGGSMLIKGINVDYIRPGPELDKAIKEREEADPDYVDKEEVERLRQERLAEKEKLEEEKRLAEEEKEKMVMCSIDMDVPASLLIGDTATITANIKNEGGETVGTLEFDLSDVEYYFTLHGSLRFANIGPGEETSSSVKIKAKQEEGIYPILIEIKEDGKLIERRFSIRVEGKDSY